MHLDVAFTLSRDDVNAALGMHRENEKPSKLILALAVVVLVLFAVLLAVVARDRQAAALALAIPLAFVSILVFFRPVLFRPLLLRADEQVRQIRLSDEGIDLRFGPIHLRFDWTKIKRVSIDDRGVLLYPIDHFTLIFIPARVIDPSLHLSDLSSFLTSKLKGSNQTVQTTATSGRG